MLFKKIYQVVEFSKLRELTDSILSKVKIIIYIRLIKFHFIPLDVELYKKYMNSLIDKLKIEYSIYLKIK